MKLNDAIITDPNDELYDLQEKYNVKISRSNSSNAVYVFRNRNDKIIRIGHWIPENQKHLWNFDKNIIKDKVNKNVVEKVIKQFFK